MLNTLTSNMQNTQKDMSYENGLRAVLLDKDLGMCELWLPSTVEGKYTFPITGEQLSIIAEDSKWVARISDPGYFFVNDAQTGVITKNKITLHNHSLNVLHIDDKVYSLYLECNSDTSRSFHPYCVRKNTDILIGREITCDIQYKNGFVSREHAVLRYDGNSFAIADRNSTNGVYVNGKKIQTTTELVLGDVVFIVGLRIIIGADFIAINNIDKCEITSNCVADFARQDTPPYLAPLDKESNFYDRKPRKKYKLDQKVIDIDMPPAPVPKTKMPLALRMGSSALMGGQALLTGNFLGAATSLVFPSLTQGWTEKDKQEYEAKRVERYRAYLQSKKEEIDSEIQLEENFYNDIFPGFNKTREFVDKRSRLWERRKKDDDFLTVRLGSGTIPMAAQKRYQERKFEMEPDFLQEEMYALVEQPSLLHDVPITISLTEDWVLGITGEQNKVMRMVLHMIFHLSITHAYDEVKLVILAPEYMEKELAFTKYLQHFWNNERTVRFFATNSSDMQAIAKYFRDKEIFEDQKSSFASEKPKHPAVVVFALDKNMLEQAELFKELLKKDKYNGCSFIAAFENAPKECTKLIKLNTENRLVDLNNSEAMDIAIKIDDFDIVALKKSMDNLSKIKLLLEQENLYSLPSMMTFLEMYDVGMVEHLNPISRWKSNNPVQSLAVPIGVGTDGNLFTLDLHEKHQGPHGLVAGMTGSGKSEFIITYILSLAVNFSPDEVAFVLIDYKGGGLADAFVDPKRGIHLPHVVATITNLDGAAIQRSLTSIHSELSRRQEMFKKAKSETGEGTMDIYDYQRLYRNKRVSEPMPHLFIISDEFAELKKQQPEFMDALISAARIGRSLGVHLILATQKPGGVVNDQIWSNTKFRACLKVQDRSDSMEMLKRPEAAELKQTGRFYLQVGYNEFFALGQSAWCGAGYIPQDDIVKEIDSSVDFIDNSGQVILKSKEKENKGKAKSKQIVAIVQYLSDLAKKENIVPRSLWCNPLPPSIEYKTLAMDNPVDTASKIESLIGLVDDPQHQKQMPLFLDMNAFHHMALCGTAGSGKSTFFKTMLYSLVMNYTPEDVNFYILDLSGGVLSSLRNTPHCGAYLTKENEADFDRMLALIQGVVDERKKIFAEAEVYSYEDYIKVHKAPLILAIFDGWTNINDFAKGQEYTLTINKNMREAANYGVRFMYSINHVSEFTAKVRQEIDYMIALQAKDKFDYNDILNLRDATMPPEYAGRGLCAIQGRSLEYQVAVPNSKLDAHQQSIQFKEELAERSKQLSDYKSAKCLPVMDDQLEYVNFCNSFDNDRIPLGFSMQTMAGVAIPLQQLYTAGLYFGNPLGVKPIIFNLLSAFKRENADAIIVRRKSGTIFDRKTENELREMYGERYQILDSTKEDLSTLFDKIIVENIPTTRVPHRNEYCELHGIPANDKGRTIKAAKYIRSKTTPIFVLFESFADLVSADENSDFAELFGKIKGFNIYFAAGFYPEDESLSMNKIFRSFNKEGFSLFFGGQFHKQWIDNLPSEYKRMEKVNQNYNRFIMKYRNDYYKMVMPCGELLSANTDPDENSIV